MEQAHYFMTALSRNWFFTGYLLVFFAFGVGCVVYGAVLHILPVPSTPRRWLKHHWLRQMQQWRIALNDAERNHVIVDVMRSWRLLIQAPGLIGMGCGILLVTALEATAFVYNVGEPFIGILFSDYGFFALFYLVGLLGLAVGHVVGVRRWRKATSGQDITYAELRNRSLSDYRSPLIFWLMLALIIVELLVTAIIAPHMGKSVTVETLLGGRREIPISPPLLLTLPALMLLTLGISELIMGQVTARSRLLLTSNPKTAQRLDDMLRGITIGAAQGFTLIAIAYLGVAQQDLLAGVFAPTSYLSYPFTDAQMLQAWLDLGYIVTLFGGLPGFLLMACNGRIGGRLSGWPWRPPRAESQAA